MLLPTTDAHAGGVGTPLVLLHGLNGSWRVWRPVLPALEARHAVYAPTLVGHRGGPALDPGPNGIKVIADEMEQRLDRAGIPRAHLVGNSLGGWLALELASRGRALSVTAFAPAGTWTNPRDLRRVGRLMKLARSSAGRPSVARLLDKPRYRRVLLRSAMERGDLIPVEDMRGMSADLEACTVLDGLLAALGVSGPVRELAMAKDCPIRIVWPQRDRTIPFERYGAPWTRALPDAEIVRAAGIGHVPMYDDPDLVTRMVLEVAERADSPTSA